MPVLRRLAAIVLLLAALAPPAAGVPSRREIGREMRGVLADWAAGQSGAALSGMRELERPVVGEGGERYRDRLRRAEEGILREIARQAPEGLVPWIALQLVGYREHVAAGEPLLAVRSRLQAEIGVDLYRRSSEDPDRDRIAVAALTELGARLQAGRQESAAATLYEKALALDRFHPPALLGLAVIREKQGSPAAALDLLGRLLEVEPQHREAQLRWAVDQRRIGGEARATLEGLVGGETRDWIDAVAHQELADLLGERGELGAAIAAARRGLVRHTCDPVLPARLSRLLDLAGSLADPELPGAIRRCAGRSEPSPRTRYNRVELDALLPADERLGAWERPRRTDLARVVGGSRR